MIEWTFTFSAIASVLAAVIGAWYGVYKMIAKIRQNTIAKDKEFAERLKVEEEKRKELERIVRLSPGPFGASIGPGTVVFLQNNNSLYTVPPPVNSVKKLVEITAIKEKVSEEPLYKWMESENNDVQKDSNGVE